MKQRKQKRELIFFAVILVLVLVILYSGLQILESTVLRPAQRTELVKTKTVTRDGVAYFPRQDMTVVLVLGIDRFGPVEESGAYNNRGAADMNVLLIFDEVEKTCNVLHLNRDTMLQMPVLGVGGRQAGTIYGQLALAHTYGTGLEDSCENSRKTISDLFYGLKIDYYVAMNMDAIGILNDAVGGVTVHVTDDFSAVDPTITMGEMTLKGDQAVSFVRNRAGVGDQLNTSRMERQKEYLNGFAEAFRAAQERDPGFLVDAYEAASPYIVTDCSVNAISGMIERYGDFEVQEIISPAGRSVLGEQYYEFYLDEEKLDELILGLFYAPKE